MKVIPITTIWTRAEVENDEEYLYLFTDNSCRTSGSNPIDKDSHYHRAYMRDLRDQFFYPASTQAVIRGLGNAFPITTMIDSNKTQLDDKYYDLYRELCIRETGEILVAMARGSYKGIKFSSLRSFGIGQYSTMKVSAPRCFWSLNQSLAIIGIDNTSSTPTPL